MSKYLTLVLATSLLVSCAKKSFDQSEEPKMQLLLALNSGSSDEVISKLEGRNDLDQDEKYYLASAYTMKGGLDVASLFPLLEMYLFNQPAYKWSGLKDVKDPYKKFIKKATDVETSSAKDERIKLIADLDPEMREKFGVDEEYSCPGQEDLVKHYDELLNAEILKYRSRKKGENYFFPSIVSNQISEAFPRSSYYNQANPNASYDCLGRLGGKGYAYYEYENAKAEAIGNEEEGLSLNEEKQDTENLTKTQLKTLRKTKNYEALILEVLWNTYEAIPFLQKIPHLDNEGQAYITKAIDIQVELSKIPSLKEKSTNNVIYLSVLSLLSIYKTSINVDKVVEVRDILCQFKPDTVIDSFEIIKSRVQTVKDMISQNEKLSAQHGPYLGKIQGYIDGSPAYLSDSNIEAFNRKLRKVKLDKCILN